MDWQKKLASHFSEKKQGLNLPSLDLRDVKRPSLFEGYGWEGGGIPNASLIYGVAAALLFSVALYLLFTGSWLNSFLVLVIAGALFGFALHYLRHPD